MSLVKRFLKTNFQLIVSLAVALLVYAILMDKIYYLDNFIPTLHTQTVYLVVWDSFMLVYLMLVLRLFSTLTSEDMEVRSHQEYEKKTTMMVLICVTSVFSIISIVREMSVALKLEGWLATFHISLTFFTLVLSWLFMHTLFALYYAHAYYKAENDSKFPMDFPYEDAPDYWDFLYLSLGMGATSSTADISFTSRKIRRVATFHSVLSFFFNTAVLALVMEMAGSLISS